MTTLSPVQRSNPLGHRAPVRRELIRCITGNPSENPSECAEAG